MDGWWVMARGGWDGESMSGTSGLSAGRFILARYMRLSQLDFYYYCMSCALYQCNSSWHRVLMCPRTRFFTRLDEAYAYPKKVPASPRTSQMKMKMKMKIKQKERKKKMTAARRKRRNWAAGCANMATNIYWASYFCPDA